jgi:antitoxin ParD1/3/4
MMGKTTTLTVRIGGTLSEFVAENIGDQGSFDNVSEYVRDLIRRDMERADRDGFERLKAELTQAFSVPDEQYRPLTADMVMARHQKRAG